MRDIGLSFALFGMILSATGVDRLVLRGPDGALLCSAYSISRQTSNKLPSRNPPGDEQPGPLCPHGVLCHFRRPAQDV